jgi:type II secretion system protein J
VTPPETFIFSPPPGAAGGSSARAFSGGSASREARSAFTLIELLLVALLTAAIASAVTMALSRTLDARSRSESRVEAFARAAAAADRIALDAHNLVRSGDLYDARVLLADSAAADFASQHDELLLFSRSLRQARPRSEQNEGDTSEVQYRLQTPSDPRAAGHTLWRRADPVPDDTPDGGGVAVPIVEGITGLTIEAFDGATWLPAWDSDRDGYPHALRVTVLARSDADPPAEARARRTIALDRTPAPYATVSPRGEGATR